MIFWKWWIYQPKTAFCTSEKWWLTFGFRVTLFSDAVVACINGYKWLRQRLSLGTSCSAVKCVIDGMLMSTQTMVIDSDSLGMDRHFSRTWTSKSPPGKLALERKECPASTSTWLWVQLIDPGLQLFFLSFWGCCNLRWSFGQKGGFIFAKPSDTPFCSHSHLSHVLPHWTLVKPQVGYGEPSWFVGVRHISRYFCCGLKPRPNNVEPSRDVNVGL